MRKKYIDFLRQLAMFYMFFQHGVLALLKENDNQGFILLLYDIVPICPALFLFLAGYSITLSKKQSSIAKENRFRLDFIKRGFILIGAAGLLFFLEYGFQLPDLLVSSGILNTIGWLFIISAFLFRLPQVKIITAGWIAVLILTNSIFEQHGIKSVPFNYGYEPINPTLIYGFIGLLFGLILNDPKINLDKSRKIILITGFIGIALFSFFMFRYGGFQVFAAPGRLDVERTFHNQYMLENLFDFSGKHNPGSFNRYVWNYKMDNFYASLGAVFILFSAAYFLEKFFVRFLPQHIFLPGRYAFINYFYHLLVIAIIVVFFNYNIFSLFWFCLFLFLLFTVSYLLSFFLLWYKTRKKTIV